MFGDGLLFETGVGEATNFIIFFFLFCGGVAVEALGFYFFF